VAVGDLNGDGVLDLAVSNFGGGVSVLIGLGNGTFMPMTQYAAGVTVSSVAIGDISGDGRADLIAANLATGTFTILKGDMNRGKEFRDLVNAVIVTANLDSLTGNGATATATTDLPHPFRSGDIVTISGATPATFNGTFEIIDHSSTTFRFLCGAVGTAGGAVKRATRPRETYPFMQWTLANLEHLQRTAMRTARHDQYLIPVGGGLSLVQTGVLTNDVAAPSPLQSPPCLTASLSTTPDDGELSFLADGRFEFTPPALFAGMVRFQYRAAAALTPLPVPNPACSGGSARTPLQSDPAWVSVVVGPCAPVIEEQPESAEFMQGSTATFRVRASTSAGRLLFRWRLDGGDLEDGPTGDGAMVTGSSGPVLVIANMQPSQRGVFTCLVSSACEQIESLGAGLGDLCTADYNSDGGIDGADVQAFFDDWEQGYAAADVNRDGGVDGSDVGFFFSQWEAGGCD